jgi:hypothetical protein
MLPWASLHCSRISDSCPVAFRVACTPPTSRRRVAHGRYLVSPALRPKPKTNWQASSPMRSNPVPGLDAFLRGSGARGASRPSTRPGGSLREEPPHRSHFVEARGMRLNRHVQHPDRGMWVLRPVSPGPPRLVSRRRAVIQVEHFHSSAAPFRRSGRKLLDEPSTPAAGAVGGTVPGTGVPDGLFERPYCRAAPTSPRAGAREDAGSCPCPAPRAEARELSIARFGAASAPNPGSVESRPLRARR